MIIGTVRIEEARAYDSHAGYHQFHSEETPEPHGSFEVFWLDEVQTFTPEDPDDSFEVLGDVLKPGWYWWACFPGCLPDGEAAGPFAYSQQAHQDADEWAPEYDLPDLSERTCNGHKPGEVCN